MTDYKAQFIKTKANKIRRIKKELAKPRATKEKDIGNRNQIKNY